MSSDQQSTYLLRIKSKKDNPWLYYCGNNLELFGVGIWSTRSFNVTFFDDVTTLLSFIESLKEKLIDKDSLILEIYDQNGDFIHFDSFKERRKNYYNIF